MSPRSGAILGKIASNRYSRGDGVDDLQLGRCCAFAAGGNEIVAKTTAQLQADADSHQRGRVDRPSRQMKFEMPTGWRFLKDRTGSPSWPTPRTLLSMWSQREVIDYALQRRSTLQALRRPGRRLARQEACDADPMLIRAAKHHGEPSNINCPVCDADELVNLQYVFGDQLGQYSGRIKQTTELEEMAHAFGEFKVVVVEVCPACGWNHMVLSYLLGDGVKRKPPRRQQTVEDIYG